MERDFEKEFKELKQNEIPDLWNRIEAGLSERKETAPIRKINAPVEKIHLRKWGTLAAACLCAAIIIPAISLAIRNGDKKNNSGAGMADGNMSASTTSDTAMESAPMDYAEAPAEEYEEADGTMAGAASTEEGTEHSADTGAAADIQSTPQDTGADSEQKNMLTEAPAETESTVNDAASGADADFEAAEDERVIEHITVEITEIAEVSGQDAIYQAVVITPDAETVFEKDMQIELICDSDTVYDSSLDDSGMKEGGQYEVSLRIEDGKHIVINVSQVD